MADNAFLKAYTKYQMRVLAVDPEYDLSRLTLPVRPNDIKPMGKEEFRNNVKLLVGREKKNIPFTMDEFLDTRFSRSSLPAIWCKTILTHITGITK